MSFSLCYGLNMSPKSLCIGNLIINTTVLGCEGFGEIFMSQWLYPDKFININYEKV
jgi:hypothetical protein